MYSIAPGVLLLLCRRTGSGPNTTSMHERIFFYFLENDDETISSNKIFEVCYRRNRFPLPKPAVLTDAGSEFGWGLRWNILGLLKAQGLWMVSVDWWPLYSAEYLMSPPCSSWAAVCPAQMMPLLWWIFLQVYAFIQTIGEGGRSGDGGWGQQTNLTFALLLFFSSFFFFSLLFLGCRQGSDAFLVWRILL